LFLFTTKFNTYFQLDLHCLSLQGGSATAIEPGVFSFVNHGCNGTYNMGPVMAETESTFEVGQPPPASVLDTRGPAYDPFAERHFQATDCQSLISVRSIRSGEELLENYLSFGGDTWWDSNLAELKSICSGGAGLVSSFEAGDLTMLDLQ